MIGTATRDCQNIIGLNVANMMLTGVGMSSDSSVIEFLTK
jgi:hypothetical protein